MKKIGLALWVTYLLSTHAVAESSHELHQLFNQRDIGQLEKIIVKEPHNGEAYYMASLYYKVGEDELGTNKNEEKSIEYLKKSAEEGYDVAQLQYGFALLNQGSTKGIDFIEKSARQGSTEALALLGDLYFAGYQDHQGKMVMTPNLDQAMNYLQKAVEKDNADARYTLGHIYLNEDLGYFDVQKALTLFDKNIDFYKKTAHLPTLITLIDLYTEGKIVEPNRGRLLDYNYLASLQDYGPAVYTIGMLQRTGDQGEKIVISKDMDAAFINLHKAATLGYVDAMYRIGEMYFKGEGVAQSDTDAYIWTAIAEELTGAETKYSDTILELIPKRQRKIAVDNKNHILQFFMVSEDVETFHQ
ncbi:tetratricopeptide repeat protein [Wohlfahrtiimonas chitiniclastica]|uniref:tetratricopeptide repeat protein n=1 Tax=Wohlfahrtiimonas chitiniclastica TaxID=400946 RepID=UPI001BCD6B5C|nr:SEL1-like repeat protein [Wohlfahrtiimonas chitiniclastica]MBS7833392.1 sel1 repeat family protein [Wohlfahrtiimonas chitiniclastica]MBS7836399.1 sel1 repeat family protein [Wohlfahrtiimonas chitiniclastica]